MDEELANLETIVELDGLNNEQMYKKMNFCLKILSCLSKRNCIGTIDAMNSGCLRVTITPVTFIELLMEEKERI